jgi:carbonic anhydrase
MGHELPPSAIGADEALARLVAGNDRFCRGEAESIAVTPETLSDLSKGQSPFVTILGCSDSRVAPELIFDAGLGELFVVRVAGNVFSPEIAGSLQYAGAHLQTPLFVVLGHEGCGAVGAALEAKHEGVRHHRHIQILVDSILPGLSGVDSRLDREAQLSRAVESNVRWTVRQICETPEGRARLKEGRVRIVGAIYEIESGRVKFLPGA